MKPKDYMNISAKLLSDEIKPEGQARIKVQAKMPGSEKEAIFTLEVDSGTYVSSHFKKDDRIRIISALKTPEGKINRCPAIIACEDFKDIFRDDVELLRSFRKCSRSMQEMIIARNNATHYDITEAKKERLDDYSSAKAYYKLTRDTFTPEQQDYIEEWLENYHQGKNSDRLEIILSISPIYKDGNTDYSIEEIRSGLDSSFSGMETQKDKIIRHLAATRRCDSKGTVICLVGPAGVGKTALIRKLGELLGKPFAFVPCTGFANALDITGDRKVYEASDVGKIVDAFYHASTSDCLIQLDEFDKMPGIDTASSSKDGNPYYAFSDIFSEKLVPDTFLGVKVPCDNTIFICTCNSLDNIPSFIKSRFDTIIQIPAYTDTQLVDIAANHLIPKMQKRYNVPEAKISFSEKAINEILRYIDDFGARRTEDHLEEIFQQIIASWNGAVPSNATHVTAEMVDGMLEKVVDMNDPRVRLRQHINDYSPEVQRKVVEIEERLDAPFVKDDEKQTLRKQLEYFINLRPDSTPLVFDSTAFFEKVNKRLYGMEREKELLASMFYELQVKKGTANKRIMLMGAPGTGKSALIQAAAEAAGLPYIRVSLNGVSDPRVISGYGKSYKDADAGIIVREVSKHRTLRALIHLDELDKANPKTQSALISLLDDSGLFADNFLEGIPIDFRSAIFVATANDYNFSPALYSRFSVIHVDSYSREEQNEILNNYLIPDACCGYEGKNIVVADDAKRAIMRYADAAGVRELKEKAVRVIRESVSKRRNASDICIHIHENDVYRILGPTPMERGNRPDASLPGISNGLAVTGSGAGMCFAIESRILPGSGIEITGLPSEVVIDSVKLAMAVLTADYNMDFTGKKVHIHFAEGAVKKNGPSAGTSIMMSLYSAMRNEAIPKSCCFTGEIDLHGFVWAVGGIVEKVGAADVLGIETAYIPKKSFENLSDAEHKKLSAMRIDVVPVSDVREIIEDVYAADFVKAIA